MGRATPFAGWEVQGRAAMTVVGGREVFTDEVMKTNRDVYKRQILRHLEPTFQKVSDKVPAMHVP